MSALPALEAYRLWAPTYDAENAFTTLECELVDRLSLSPRGKRLLDVGCGTGRRLVGTGAAQAVGVEPCAEMLAAGRRAHDFGPEVRLIEGDARALPVSDAIFDLVWCRLVIGHLPDCREVFSELGRATAPRGKVLVTDFHPAAYASGLRRTFRDSEQVVEVEHYVHSMTEQVAAAASAGLRLSSASETHAGPSVRHYYEAGGKGALYAEHCKLPLVSALAFIRDA